MLRYFKPEEFACKCGCGLGFNDMNLALLLALDTARDRAGIPFKVTSAMRCEDHNAAVGGKPNSAHLHGCAVDIAAANSFDRFQIIRALISVGLCRIGVAKDFIHVDCDQSKPQSVFWLY